MGKWYQKIGDNKRLILEAENENAYFVLSHLALLH